MDLVDKIERTEFLGPEFLIWLWFATEVTESQVVLADKQAAELWLEGQLVLTDPHDPQEKITLAGVAPSGGTEAKEALRQGKRPARARLNLTVGEQSYEFSLEASPFALSGVKLPTLVNEEIDEQFYERMMLLEQLEQIVGGLLEGFVRLRMSKAWGQHILPLIQSWVQEADSFDANEAKRRVMRVFRTYVDAAA